MWWIYDEDEGRFLDGYYTDKDKALAEAKSFCVNKYDVFVVYEQVGRFQFVEED